MIRRPATVYSTDDSSELAAYQLYSTGVDEFHQACIDLAHDIGSSRARIWSVAGAANLVGFEPTNTYDEPPEGYRLDKHAMYWVPDKRSEIGRTYADIFNELHVDAFESTGMPATLKSPMGKRLERRLEVFDGRLWATWETDTSFAEMHSALYPDGPLVGGPPWTQERLSRYHVKVEQAVTAKELAS